MTDAIQYGALGLLAVVLGGVGVGIKMFGLPILREHLALTKALRDVLPRLAQNVERMRVVAENVEERSDQQRELVSAIAQDVHWFCGVVSTLVTNVEGLKKEIAKIKLSNGVDEVGDGT